MTFDLGETIDTLERTPRVVDALLRGTAASRHEADEGPATWSAREVLAHLVYGEETDWIPRARQILARDDHEPFESFDRAGHAELLATRSLDGLLDELARRRRENLETLRGWGLGDEELALRGRHPELGFVTLRQLLATWAVHDLGHIAQMARVMAKASGDEVGPWRAYLSILGR